MLPKNQIVGRCQLILQPNEGAYLQDMAAMQQEGIAEKDNPIIRNNPEVGEDLIRVLQKKGQAFEGGAQRDQIIGQGVAGRTD